MVHKRKQYRGGYTFSGSLMRSRELRRKATSAETVLWELLKDRQVMGFKFRRQHQFGDYIADFYCHEATLVIECDGPIHQSNEQWIHDRNRDTYMFGQGLRVLRFTNEEVLGDVANVLDQIKQTLSRINRAQ